MNATSLAFSEIGLHDAKIERIERHPGTIILALDFAVLIQGHPSNPLREDHLMCVSPKLTFIGVSKEESRTWIAETKQWESHRHPSHPLDAEVMESKHESDHFFLSGFHQDGWSEWLIWADSFELTWDTDHPSRPHESTNR